MKKTILLTNLVALLAIGYWLVANSQVAPEFLVSWKTDSYVPPGYIGKALPTRNSRVDIALELIDNGRLVNLSQNEIRWFVNNKLQKSGMGIKNFTMLQPTINVAPEIRISVINYRGINLDKTITIPLANPDVAIISVEGFTFRALPYFFNIKTANELKYTWSVNDFKTEGEVNNPDILTLDVRGGQIGNTLNLKLLVKNLANPLEQAVLLTNLLLQ